MLQKTVISTLLPKATRWRHALSGRRVSLFILLCAFWAILSGIWSTGMMVTMMVSAFLTVTVVEKAGMMPNIALSKRGIIYIPYMLKSMLSSSLKTIQLISGPSSHFSSGVSKIKFPSIKSNTEAMMHASAITMTPGTVVIGINKKNRTMFVHGIDKSLLSELPDKVAQKVINGITEEDGRPPSAHKSTSQRYFGEVTKEALEIVRGYTKRVMSASFGVGQRASRNKKEVLTPPLAMAKEATRLSNKTAKGKGGDKSVKSSPINTSSLLRIKNQQSSVSRPNEYRDEPSQTAKGQGLHLLSRRSKTSS